MGDQSDRLEAIGCFCEVLVLHKAMVFAMVFQLLRVLVYSVGHYIAMYLISVVYECSL